MTSFKEINLILGDSISEIIKSISKEDIKKSIRREVRGYDIGVDASLGEVCQLYIDKVIGTRKKLIERLNEVYETIKDKEESRYKLIFDSKVVKTLFDARFSKINVGENQSIHTPFDNMAKICKKEERIYKLLGYLKKSSNDVILTSQDIKRLKITAIYEEYWKNLMEDFKRYDSVLFAEDLKDRDFLEVFSIMLKYNRDSDKRIYVLSSEVLSPQIQEFIDRNGLLIVSGSCQEFFSYLEERERIENRVEPKEVSILWDRNLGKLETANEIRYESLRIGKLPISRSTFCSVLNFEKENLLGNGEVTYRGKKINDCVLKLYHSPSIKVFEISAPEFKIGIEAEITPKGEIKFKGKDFYYNIYKNNSNDQVMNGIEFFTNFFQGEELKFKSPFISGTLKLENRIEVLRLGIIRDVLEKYKHTYKFSEVDENIYLLDMMRNVENDYSYDSWINLDFKRDINFNAGDILNIERIYETKLKNIDYDILEKIEFIGEKKENYRGKAKITLRKISKSEVEVEGERDTE